MHDIEFTDQYDEQVRIGKALLEENPAIYTDVRLNDMRQLLKRLMTPKLTRQFDETEFLLHTIYDYWAYGNDLSEDIYLGFYKKSHEEKLEYMTLRKCVLWAAHFDNRIAVRLLENKYEAYQFLHDYYKRDVVLISGLKDLDKFLSFLKKHQPNSKLVLQI